MNNRKHILIIRPGALGDTLMLMPSIFALRPTYKISVAGRRPGIEFLAPYVGQYFDMDDSVWHRLFISPPAPKGLPAKDAEVVICFMGDPDGIIHRNLKIYYPAAGIFLYPSLPLGGPKRHVAHYVAEGLKASGIDLDPQSVLRTAMENALLGNAEDCSRQYLVLHPGSGSKNKNYSIYFWLELIKKINRLFKDSSSYLKILLGPAEQEIGPQLAGKVDFNGLEIVNLPSPFDLLRLMEKTRILIGHDSGVSHVAAMTGAGTITLFKTTDPALWHPLGPRVAVVKGIEDEEILLARVLEHLKGLL